MNDVVAVIEAPSEDITLYLDSEELHYLCQETNRPTLGVNWDYLGLVYLSSYSYSSSLPYFIRSPHGSAPILPVPRSTRQVMRDGVGHLSGGDRASHNDLL